MTDEDLVQRISRLVEEEHRLERSHVGEPLSEDELARMRDLEIELDGCWDLLRQRRARREFAQDPESVAPRDPEIVEGYRQ